MAQWCVVFTDAQEGILPNPYQHTTCQRCPMLIMCALNSIIILLDFKIWLITESQWYTCSVVWFEKNIHIRRISDYYISAEFNQLCNRKQGCWTPPESLHWSWPLLLPQVFYNVLWMFYNIYYCYMIFYVCFNSFCSCPMIGDHHIGNSTLPIATSATVRFPW